MHALLLTLMIFSAEDAPRFDHRGAVGLLLGVHGARKETGGDNVIPDNGWRGGFDLGATINIGYASNELLLVGRLGLGGAKLETSLYTGYRNYFGSEQIKTMLDIDLAVHFTPFVTVGPRFGVGVQWDFSSIAGAYAQIAGQIGAGQILMFKAELVLGVQLRSFLLE